MSIRDNINKQTETGSREVIDVPGVQIPEPEDIVPTSLQIGLKDEFALPPKPSKEEYTIDNALDFKKKAWRKMYYDITTKPSQPGLYVKDFGGDVWDLRRLETYVNDTFALIHLPSVLKYKGAQIKSKKKGYIKFETTKR